MPQAGAADDVTIYQCVDARQQLTMSSTPCPAGQQQQTRSMLRPKDAPAASAPAAPAPPVPAAPARVQVVVVNTPRPLYECVRPDGSVYESDSDAGEPRWVPLWTLGYPGGPHGLADSRGLSAPPRASISGSTSASISAPSVAGAGPRPPVRAAAVPARGRDHPRGGGYNRGGYYGGGAGTWVRDACNALPQSEVCARLDDRRDALRTRFFNAQQRERDVLRVEERGLNARLANDCGVH